MEWVAAICSFIGNLAWKADRLAFDLEPEWWCPDFIPAALHTISDFLEAITGKCVRFAFIVGVIESSIKEFLTRFDLDAILLEPLRRLGELWSWFLDRISEVKSIIAEWWEAAKDTVLGWISTFVDVVYQLLDDLEASITELSSRWDDFWTITLPTLASHLDVAEAINNLRKEWSDLLDTWSELSEDIKLFFADPLGWLYERLEDFFDRWW